MTTLTAADLRCPPRFATPRSLDRPTLGPGLAKVAEKLGKPYLPHQHLIADTALEIDPETGYLAYDEVIVIINRQQGKALDVATPVLTDRGWSSMGRLMPGDRVFHPDGHAVEVTYASPVMTGHACYRVRTTDGRELIADADHLWTAYDRNVRRERTLTTSEILAAGLTRPSKTSRDYRWRLPHQRAIKSPDVALPLDPYLLGVWLGDGTASRAEVTSADPEIFDAFRAEGFATSYAYPTGRAWTRGVLGLVKVLRLMGVLRNKHVPAEYLAAGYDQRLALLQGLMDTDGCIRPAGQCEFTITSQSLAESVLYLARSLGWRATVYESAATLYGREVGPRWRVRFTASAGNPVPFRLARKAGRIRPSRARNGERTAVSIMSIEPVESRPVRCIKVDSPDGLFLAGADLIATHNTEFMFPLMTHRCTGFTRTLSEWIRRELGHAVPDPGPQRVLYTAQTADNAKQKWRDIHVKRLEESPFRRQFGTRLRTNFEQMEWTNGSTWSPGATTAKTGGTGDTIDLAVIDEAWSKEDMRTELGLRPAMLTRPWRQLWVASMIPGIARALPGSWPYLHTKRQNGRARVQAGVRSRVAYFEWSAAEDMDPADPDTWWSCMPALGHTVQESAIASDFEALGLVDFSAEYLGWEPDATAARWLVVSENTWRGLAGIPEPKAYLEPIAFGVHAAPDQTVASIGMSALSPSGDTYVELIERQPGLTWAVPALVDLSKRMSPCSIGIAAHGPAAPIIDPLRRALLDANVDTELVILQGPALSRACRQFYLETGEVGVMEKDRTERRIRHVNQPELNDSVAMAQKYTYGDEWRWQQEGADSLYAVTLARAAGEDVEWLGGSYAVGDSLG